MATRRRWPSTSRSRRRPATRSTAVEYNGEQAKVKAMVEAKHVNWDVVEVESGDIGRGCDEGLYEKLDWSKIGKKSDLMPEAPHTCGVGFFVWSTALAYNADKLKTAPSRLGRFLGRQEVPGQARHAQGRALQPRIRADGRRRAAEGRLQGARHQGRRRPRVQEARRAEAEHPVVGSGRAAAAVPGRGRRGDVHRLQRPHRRRADRKART